MCFHRNLLCNVPPHTPALTLLHSAAAHLQQSSPQYIKPRSTFLQAVLLSPELELPCILYLVCLHVFYCVLHSEISASSQLSSIHVSLCVCSDWPLCVFGPVLFSVNWIKEFVFDSFLKRMGSPHQNLHSFSSYIHFFFSILQHQFTAKVVSRHLTHNLVDAQVLILQGPNVPTCTI